MGDRRRNPKKYNVVTLLCERERKYNAAANFQRHTQVTTSLIERLGLEYELEGHKGCVNCIEWSKDGRRLASGSDDTKVIIWDPFRHKKLATIHTPHIGNIFSVKFLGGNNDPLLVTGAADCHVVVQSVDQEPGDAPILNCLCHAGRVKRIATPPDQPQLFWSAGEDGLVMQYDLREPHHCISGSTVFLDLTRNLGWAAEAKCLAINPVKPHLIAVGANDCFVRIYDRRMVKTMPYRTNHHVEHRERNIIRPDPSLDVSCVQYYAPGHLAKCSSDMRYKLAATYISFDPSGNELLVNMGGEHIYLFDMNNTRNITEIQVPETALKSSNSSSLFDDCCSKEHSLLNSCRKLSLRNEEILDEPCSCHFLGRATTLFERKWIGDVYAAARDYLHVVKNWPNIKDAYIGLVKCLMFLKWNEIALEWLTYFRHRFTESANTPQIISLKADLLKPIKSEHEELEDVPVLLPDQEVRLRDMAIDFESRYLGHCNTTTDIKEANFFGPNGQYIIAGSDDGIFFIWDRQTTNIVRAMWGDVSIVNCVQPHPTCCLLATSGIDPVVKLWSPLPEDGHENLRVILDPAEVVLANQHRISMDPFETMLANMGYRVRTGPIEAIQDMPSCRAS